MLSRDMSRRPRLAPGPVGNQVPLVVSSGITRAMLSINVPTSLLGPSWLLSDKHRNRLGQHG